MSWKKYPIYQEGSEFILADGTRAPIASHPKQSLKSSAVNATVDETGRIKEFTNHGTLSVTFHVQHRLKERAPSFIKAIYSGDSPDADSAFLNKMNSIVAAVALLNQKHNRGK